MKFYWYSTLLWLMVGACGTPAENTIDEDSAENEEICVLPAPNRMDELAWMLGSWEINSQGTRTVESWSLDESKKMMIGQAVTVELASGDTVFSESLLLHHENTGLVYTPTIADQNDGEPVDFLNTELTDERVVFENAQHDFPQKITYLYLGANEMTAIVSGTLDGKFIADTLAMKRINL